jgi:hypothetical protein
MKASIINELLASIPETVTHKFGCHIWQRVFETKWTTYPGSHCSEVPPKSKNAPTYGIVLDSDVHPIILVVRKMNHVMKGLWHTVANDESGSLVVQCIFENCPESEKRDIIDEVLVHAAEIAKGN